MVGISYLFIGILDLLHTLAYKGMPIFTDYEFYANQLWIAARGLESSTLLIAFIFLHFNKFVKAWLLFVIYSLITAFLIASIFYWKIFPICFVAGTGLTDFKVYSEYVICTVLAASIVLLIRNRNQFDHSVYKLLLLSMIYTIISELAFTFYIDNFGISNIVGHYFKLFSFMMIYRAIVTTGIEEPYRLVFNELNQTNENLQHEVAVRKQSESELESEIHERKKIEDAQLESDLRFRLATESTGVGIWEWSTTTNQIRWDSQMFSIYGITPTVDGFIPYSIWRNAVLPEDLSEQESILNETAQKGGTSRREFRIQRNSDKEYRNIQAVETTRTNSAGQIEWVVGTNLDITERKQAEGITARLLLRQRAILDNLPMMAWLKDTESRLEMVNKPYADICGHTVEECIGKTDLDLFPEEMAKGYMADDHEVCITGQRKQTEEKIGTQSGTRWHMTYKTPLFDEQGVINGTTGIAQDISEHKKAEEEIRRTTANLQAANLELIDSRQATLKMMQDAITSRKQAEELNNKLKLEVDERILAEEKLTYINDELENLVKARTNDLAHTIETLQVETSERIQALEALREKEHMLIQQSRQAAMGEMIGNIAHQWRQPLNTLGLYTQRLGTFYGMPSFNKEFLDNSIAKSMEIIKHMSKTIDDFRDYFKPEKEKINFYVVETIKNTLSLLEGNFHNPKIIIDFIEHDNPIINGYQNEFAQVFLNILNNSRDIIIEREIADARVTITICSENCCAVVTVSDNAGGIPDGVINKVFDPYFTTKGPQSGTGIGLFMSKTIIEKNMGGRLTVRNTDTGAEFRVEVEHGTQN
jgi:PAS domain S-box-containing protein